MKLLCKRESNFFDPPLVKRVKGFCLFELFWLPNVNGCETHSFLVNHTWKYSNLSYQFLSLVKCGHEGGNCKSCSRGKNLFVGCDIPTWITEEFMLVVKTKQSRVFFDSISRLSVQKSEFLMIKVDWVWSSWSSPFTIGKRLIPIQLFHFLKRSLLHFLSRFSH